jgi:hypothetical protein
LTEHHQKKKPAANPMIGSRFWHLKIFGAIAPLIGIHAGVSPDIVFGRYNY